MSTYLQNLQPLVADEAPELQTYLKSELGWPEVRKGLVRIVFGYLLVTFGPVLCAVIAVLAITQGELFENFRTAKIEYKITLMIAMIGLFLSVLFGYIFMLLGHLRCLVNVSERCGAKWFMFTCMVCLVMGPALNFITGLIGGPPISDPEKLFAHGGDQVDKFWTLYKESGAIYFQIMSTVISLLAGLFFMLFLRGITRCFEDARRTAMIDYYMLFTLLLFGCCIFMGAGNPKLLLKPLFWVIPVLGSFVSFMWFLTLMVSSCNCIRDGLAKLKSPYEL